eukprot:ANDGO_04498.mRNA.1 Putative vacuolar protein sorting-associated protein 13A
MLEKIFADMLSKHIDPFVVNLTPQSLKTSVTEGNLTVTDLILREDALLQMDFPFVIRKGIIKKVSLRVPWKKLNSEPVQCDVDGVYVVLEPKRSASSGAETDDAITLQARKRYALSQYEKSSAFLNQVDVDEKSGASASAAPVSFVQYMMQTILFNLQLSVKNIHVRLEEGNCAMGFVLKELGLRTTDEKFQPKYVKNPGNFLFKRATLSMMSFYADVASQYQFSNEPLTNDEFCQVMLMTMESQQGLVVHPVKAEALCTIQTSVQSADLTIPKVNVNLRLEAVYVSVTHDQLVAVLDLAAYSSTYRRLEQFRFLRPKVRPSKDPRAWWLYAGNAVMQSLRRLTRTADVASLAKQVPTMKLRDEYISLFKKSRETPVYPALTSDERARLREMEDVMETDDLLLFRRHADAELIAEVRKSSHWGELKAKKERHLWFQGLRKLAGASDVSVNPSQTALAALTPDELNQVYSEVGYANQADSSSPSPDWVTMQFSVSLEVLQLTLKDVARVMLSGIKLRSSSSQNISDLELSLHSLAVVDDLQPSSSILLPSPSKGNSELMILQVSLSSDKINVSGLISPIDIHVRPVYIARLFSFFKLPDVIDISDLKSFGMQQMLRVSRKTANEIQKVLAMGRMKLNIALDVRAPRLILNDLVYLDLGRITVATAVEQPYNDLDTFDVSIDGLSVTVENSVILSKVSLVGKVNQAFLPATVPQTRISIGFGQDTPIDISLTSRSMTRLLDGVIPVMNAFQTSNYLPSRPNLRRSEGWLSYRSSDSSAEVPLYWIVCEDDSRLVGYNDETFSRPAAVFDLTDPHLTVFSIDKSSFALKLQHANISKQSQTFIFKDESKDSELRESSSAWVSTLREKLSYYLLQDKSKVVSETVLGENESKVGMQSYPLEFHVTAPAGICMHLYEIEEIVIADMSLSLLTAPDLACSVTVSKIQCMKSSLVDIADVSVAMSKSLVSISVASIKSCMSLARKEDKDSLLLCILDGLRGSFDKVSARFSPAPMWHLSVPHSTKLNEPTSIALSAKTFEFLMEDFDGVAAVQCSASPLKFAVGLDPEIPSLAFSQKGLSVLLYSDNFMSCPDLSMVGSRNEISVEASEKIVFTPQAGVFPRLMHLFATLSSHAATASASASALFGKSGHVETKQNIAAPMLSATLNVGLAGICITASNVLRLEIGRITGIGKSLSQDGANMVVSECVVRLIESEHISDDTAAPSAPLLSCENVSLCLRSFVEDKRSGTFVNCLVMVMKSGRGKFSKKDIDTLAAFGRAWYMDIAASTFGVSEKKDPTSPRPASQKQQSRFMDAFTTFRPSVRLESSSIEVEDLFTFECASFAGGISSGAAELKARGICLRDLSTGVKMLSLENPSHVSFDLRKSCLDLNLDTPQIRFDVGFFSRVNALVLDIAAIVAKPTSSDALSEESEVVPVVDKEVENTGDVVLASTDKRLILDADLSLSETRRIILQDSDVSSDVILDGRSRYRVYFNEAPGPLVFIGKNRTLRIENAVIVCRHSRLEDVVVNRNLESAFGSPAFRILPSCTISGTKRHQAHLLSTEQARPALTIPSVTLSMKNAGLDILGKYGNGLSFVLSAKGAFSSEKSEGFFHVSSLRMSRPKKDCAAQSMQEGIVRLDSGCSMSLRWKPSLESDLQTTGSPEESLEEGSEECADLSRDGKAVVPASVEKKGYTVRVDVGAPCEVPEMMLSQGVLVPVYLSQIVAVLEFLEQIASLVGTSSPSTNLPQSNSSALSIKPETSLLAGYLSESRIVLMNDNPLSVRFELLDDVAFPTLPHSVLLVNASDIRIRGIIDAQSGSLSLRIPSINAEHWNTTVGMWEPILDPSFGFRMRSVYSGADGSASSVCRLDPVDVVVTPSLLNSLYRCTTILANKLAPQGSENEPDLATAGGDTIVQNFTGKPVTIVVLKSQVLATLADGASKVLNLQTRQYSGDNTKNEEVFSVKVDEFLTLERVVLPTSIPMVYPLIHSSSKKNGQNSSFIVVSASASSTGKRVISLHSQTKIENDSPFPIEVEMANGVFKSVGQRDSVYLPITDGLNASDALRVRVLLPDGSKSEGVVKMSEAVDKASTDGDNADSSYTDAQIDGAVPVSLGCLSYPFMLGAPLSNEDKSSPKLTSLNLDVRYRLYNHLPHDVVLQIVADSHSKTESWITLKCGQCAALGIFDTADTEVAVRMWKPADTRIPSIDATCKEIPVFFSTGAAIDVSGCIPLSKHQVILSGKRAADRISDSYVGIDYTLSRNGSYSVTFYAPLWIVNATPYAVSIRDRDKHGDVSLVPASTAGGFAPSSAFSYRALIQGTSRAQLRFQDADNHSKWSSAFAVDGLGYGLHAVSWPSKDAFGKKHKQVVHAAVKIAPAPSPCNLTRILTISPRFVFKNSTSRAITVGQTGTSQRVSVPVGSTVPFPAMWEKHGQQDVTFSYGNDNQTISIPIAAMDRPHVLPISGVQSLSAVSSLRVFCDNQNSQTVVTVGECRPGTEMGVLPDYLFAVRNESWVPLRIRLAHPNTGLPAFVNVPPFRTMPIPHANPSDSKHYVGVTMPGMKIDEVKISLDAVGKAKPVGQSWSAFVTVDSGRRTLVVRESGTPASSIAVKPDDLSSRFQKQFLFVVPHVGVSVLARRSNEDRVDGTTGVLEELVYLSVKNVSFFQGLSSSGLSVSELLVRSVQIDHNSMNAIHPVLLSAKPSDTGSAWQIIMAQSTRDSSAGSLLAFPLISVTVPHLILKLEEVFLSRFVGLARDCQSHISSVFPTESSRIYASHRESEWNRVLSPLSGVSSTEAAVTSAVAVYASLIWIHPIAIDVSYDADPSPDAVDPVVRRARSMGINLLTVSRAPIRIDALVMKHVLCSSASDLALRLQRYYVRQAIKESYHVLGAIDLIGAPVTVLSGVASGVKSFFYEPSQASLNRPSSVVKAVGRGTSSLVSRPVASLFAATAGLSGSVARGLATATFDDDFIAKRRALVSRRHPKGFLDGFRIGAKALGRGVVAGVAGIVVLPRRRMASHRSAAGKAKGVLRGVAEGVVGIVAKPISGALDFTAKVAEGAEATVSGRKEIPQVRARPPRLLGEHGEVVPYDEKQARMFDLQLNSSIDDDVLDIYDLDAYESQDSSDVVSESEDEADAAPASREHLQVMEAIPSRFEPHNWAVVGSRCLWQVRGRDFSNMSDPIPLEKVARVIVDIMENDKKKKKKRSETEEEHNYALTVQCVGEKKGRVIAFASGDECHRCALFVSAKAKEFGADVLFEEGLSKITDIHPQQQTLTA